MQQPDGFHTDLGFNAPRRVSNTCQQFSNLAICNPHQIQEASLLYLFSFGLLVRNMLAQTSFGSKGPCLGVPCPVMTACVTCLSFSVLLFHE